MALSSFEDIVSVSTATTGTGTITLGAAVSGFRGTSALTNGATYSYTITDGSARETGQGVYTSSGTTLTRVLDASTTGGLLNLSGSATVVFDVLARDLAALGYTNIQTYTNAGTDAAVDLSSIPSRSDMVIEIIGLSHNNGSSRDLQLQLSGNNGTTKTTAVSIGFTLTAAATAYGAIYIDGYSLAAGLVTGGLGNLTADYAVASGTQIGFAWRLAAGINFVRLIYVAGSVDAGVVRLWVR